MSVNQHYLINENDIHNSTALKQFSEKTVGFLQEVVMLFFSPVPTIELIQ